jgi:hypothetical protein
VRLVFGKNFKSIFTDVVDVIISWVYNFFINVIRRINYTLFSDVSLVSTAVFVSSEMPTALLLKCM